MTSVFNLCRKLIELNRTNGLMEKMDVYLAADRLTVDEYNELIVLINASKE